MRGRDACRMHGGKSLPGAFNPAYKHGRHSKFLPTRLVAQYRAAEKDLELTNLRSELALLDARVADLLSRVDTGESGATWKALKESYDRFQQSRRAQDVAKMTAAWAEVEHHMETGTGDYHAWDEVTALIETRRKLVTTEHQRLAVLQQHVTAEQMTVMLGLIVEIIAKHVTDRQALTNIHAELQRLGTSEHPVYALPVAEEAGGPSRPGRRRNGH
jgi:ribosomal protein S15P/S13E